VSERLGVTDGLVGWIAALSLDDVGYLIVIVFAVTWAIAVAVWRYGRIEERWTAAPDGTFG
jgi:high-affinity nickel-transport protein